MDQILRELKQRTITMPRRIEAQRAYAEAQKHTVFSYIGAGKSIEARSSLTPMLYFCNRFRHDKAIQKCLLDAAGYILLYDSNKSKPLTEISFLLTVIDSAWKRISADNRLGLEMMLRSIVMGAAAYMEADKWREALAWLSKGAPIIPTSPLEMRVR
jgi:hypothetical protein